MATTLFKGNPVALVGEMPEVGSALPAIELTDSSLAALTTEQLKGSRVVLNIFPSIDTGVCATSVRRFNKEAGELDGVRVINVSADLPFAQNRFCGAEGLESVENASTFRSDAGKVLGLTMTEGPLAGLLARSVIVLDDAGVVKHAELVDDIANEPNYEAALAAL